MDVADHGGEPSARQAVRPGSEQQYSVERDLLARGRDRRSRPERGGGGPTTTVPLFNANTISTGISAADFYLAVPQAIVRFLESDTQTKLVAKPQLRGQEGQKIKLNLGDGIPVPPTTFGSLGGAGSVATQPISSFNYRPVGVIVNMTPRVTFDGDIVLELSVESSTLGTDQHRRPEPAVLRLAQGRDEDPAARWRVNAAGRVAARGRAPRPQRDHRPHSRAWPPQPVRQQRQCR